jgi:hypothetical protein
VIGGVLFRGGVPHDEASARRLEDSGPDMVRGDDDAVVVEGQLAAQPLRTPLGRPRPDPEPGARDYGHLLVSQLLRELEGRHARQLQQRFDEAVRLRDGHAHGAVLAQVGDPREGATVVEPGDALVREDEPSPDDELRRGEVEALRAAPEASGHEVVGGSRLGSHVEGKRPGQPVVPGQGERLHLGRSPAKMAASRRAE